VFEVGDCRVRLRGYRGETNIPASFRILRKIGKVANEYAGGQFASKPDRNTQWPLEGAFAAVAGVVLPVDEVQISQLVEVRLVPEIT